MTSHEEWISLTPGQQFELLLQAEFDRDGFQRLLAKEREQITALQERIRVIAHNNEEADRISESRAQENADYYRKLKALRKQIETLGHLPFAVLGLLCALCR